MCSRASKMPRELSLEADDTCFHYRRPPVRLNTAAAFTLFIARSDEIGEAIEIEETETTNDIAGNDKDDGV